MKCLQTSLGAAVARKQPAEYRQHASECQNLARNARTGQERQLLLQLAEEWEKIAVGREREAAREQRDPSSNGNETIDDPLAARDLMRRAKEVAQIAERRLQQTDRTLAKSEEAVHRSNDLLNRSRKRPSQWTSEVRSLGALDANAAANDGIMSESVGRAHMKRYFFDLRNGEIKYRDSVGSDLADDEAALRYGQQIAAELAKNRERHTLDWRIDVRNDEGTTIHAVKFTDLGQR